MPKEKKADNRELQRRVDLCLERLLQSWTPYRISQYVARMGELRAAGKTAQSDGYDPRYDWEVQLRQIYEYCNKANEALDEIHETKRTHQYKKSLAQWEDLLRKAITDQDLANARLIKKEIDKLTGVTEFGAGGGDKPADEAQIKLGDGTIINL